MPNLYIISGCNGAGKTTASYSLLPEMLECRLFVNSDEFAKSLSPFDPSAAAISASRYMLMKTKYLFGKRQDFGIETTLATRSMLNMIKDAKEQGYHVTIIYFWLSSPELAISRIKARVTSGGHNIPDETTRRRYYTGLSYFFNDYIDACDRWILVDNSSFPFSVVAEGNESGIIIRDREKYDIIWAMVHPEEK